MYLIITRRKKKPISKKKKKRRKKTTLYSSENTTTYAKRKQQPPMTDQCRLHPAHLRRPAGSEVTSVVASVSFLCALCFLPEKQEPHQKSVTTSMATVAAQVIPKNLLEWYAFTPALPISRLMALRNFVAIAVAIAEATPRKKQAN